MAAQSNAEYGRTVFFAATSELNDAKRQGDAETAALALDELFGIWAHGAADDRRLMARCAETLAAHGRADDMRAWLA